MMSESSSLVVGTSEGCRCRLTETEKQLQREVDERTHVSTGQRVTRQKFVAR